MVINDLKSQTDANLNDHVSHSQNAVMPEIMKNPVNRTIGQEIEIITNNNAEIIYRTLTEKYGVSKDWISLETNGQGGDNVLEVKRGIPLGIGNDFISEYLWQYTLNSVVSAAQETGTQLIYDCICGEFDEVQTAGIHVRLGYKDKEDKKKVTDAMIANKDWICAFSNIDNYKRVKAFGFRYGEGNSKFYDLKDDSKRNAMEIRYIPTSNNKNVAEQMESLVAAYMALVDSDDSEAHKNKILANDGICGKTYAQINHERTLQAEDMLINTKIYSVDENDDVVEKYIIDIMEEKLDYMRERSFEGNFQIIDEKTYDVMNARIQEYRDNILNQDTYAPSDTISTQYIEIPSKISESIPTSAYEQTCTICAKC